MDIKSYFISTKSNFVFFSTFFWLQKNFVGLITRFNAFINRILLVPSNKHRFESIDAFLQSIKKPLHIQSCVSVFMLHDIFHAFLFLWLCFMMRSPQWWSSHNFSVGKKKKKQSDCPLVNLHNKPHTAPFMQMSVNNELTKCQHLKNPDLLIIPHPEVHCEATLFL